MEASISSMRVLPVLPKNYTYDHLNKPENLFCVRFTVSEITRKEEFKEWKNKLETLNKENFSVRNTGTRCQSYKYKVETTLTIPKHYFLFTRQCQILRSPPKTSSLMISSWTRMMGKTTSSTST